AAVVSDRRNHGLPQDRLAPDVGAEAERQQAHDEGSGDRGLVRLEAWDSRTTSSDAKYVQEMDTIEGDPSRPSSISTMADDTKRWARELCSIWVSVMQGRPANIARGILDQNGYEAWRNLTLEMQPSSRQRQLALMVTRYEEIIAEYERISSLKFSEVPRTLPPRVPRVTLTEEMQQPVGREGMHVLVVENSADYVNEPNPFTLASRQPKPRIAMVSSSPFSVDFFPERGVPPKPSEELLRLSPGQPRAVQRDAEHRERESTEHQGRDAEHQGREPAEHHGPQHDVDEQGRVPPGLEQDELEAYVANSVAQQLQEIDRRDALPRSQPDGPPSAEEVAAHNLTHVPFRRWCEACVATRSRGDAQSAGANRETRVPVVRIDFYFTSLDDHAMPAGAMMLARAAEEVTRLTISLHGKEATILQSDGQPIKAVRAARRLGTFATPSPRPGPSLWAQGEMTTYGHIQSESLRLAVAGAARKKGTDTDCSHDLRPADPKTAELKASNRDHGDSPASKRAWESTELSPEDLAELDDQAEIEELTRLEGMEVLEYRVREDVEEEDTFSPASVATLAWLVPLLAQKWEAPIYIMDVKVPTLYPNASFENMAAASAAQARCVRHDEATG
ncbi:unnamed protein product, partial [Symbiodinium sp. KB8]